MAEEKPLLVRLGITRGKAALIAVLGVVLMGVLYLQYGSSGGTPDGSLPEYKPPRLPVIAQTGGSEEPTAAAQPPDKPAAEAELTAFDAERWKSPELRVVTAYDPFALPPKFPRSRIAQAAEMNAEAAATLSAEERAKELALAIERLQQDLEELKRRGVHVIIGGEDGYVAVSGDRTLRVGDEINGFVVTAIEPDGVRVERIGIE